jgi:sporulation protein YlmC with PRC-barrel domain
MTNNFYYNTETYRLTVKELTVEGEIANPGKVDFSAFPKHSVIVKETLLDSAGKDKFIGAYRYDGYSLFDILEKRVVQKSNGEEFGRIIDMYIEIENEKGESVVFSWGEIYYPINLHRILIADGVSRIVPTKTKDLWDLPVESRIVAGNDLVTERNISSPVKITVSSFPKSFRIVKDLFPMFSEQIKLFGQSNFIGSITDYPPDLKEVTYGSVFYGRGRGIHSTEPFTGLMLKEILSETYPLTKESLKLGILCIAAQDGYRCALSYSELFNRNDQQEFLLVKTGTDEDGGLFRVFPACDFFSDRAVKSISEVHLGY